MTSTPTTNRRTSVLAIVGFVLAILFSIVGGIISIVALVQINRTGEGGRGLAIAGIIIGFALFVVGLIVDISVLPHVMNAVNQ